MCCPKPCKNPSDVYDATSGQCYEPVGFDEPCEVDEQCLGRPGSSFSPRIRSRNEKPLQCLSRPDGNDSCGCKLGYIEQNGRCISESSLSMC
ncbi:MAG: hypothetical protein GY696_19410 [Gammaproteobacteria bacterium]|nr:hypothetical protein [Gammaproteobacteria bacterium]